MIQELYEALSSVFPAADDIHDGVRRNNILVQVSFHCNAGKEDFLALNRLEGYQHKNVTPYMHSLVYHVPDQI